jgi:hypothetical protein
MLEVRVPRRVLSAQDTQIDLQRLKVNSSQRVLEPASVCIYQNLMPGSGPFASTSVETLTSCQRSASCARVASAWPAY